MPPTLADRLSHILDATKTIQNSLANETRESFAADTMLRAGVERLLEIISEASRHIPADAKVSETGISWQRMADLGNLLRHAYHSIDAKIRWDIVERDLPPLKASSNGLSQNLKARFLLPALEFKMNRKLMLAFSAVCGLMALTFPALAQSDLARAYRVISGKQYVDLTHAFSPTTPVWSGFGQAKFTPAYDPQTKAPYTIAKDGFRTTYYDMVGQYGTHVDPPAHFAETGITMDKIPLKQMILPLIVLDATPYLAKDPNHAFSLADLRAWERRHGRIRRGAFVALRTDMSKDFDTNPERFKRSPFPAWAFETVKFLFEQRGAVAIGHESLDTDTTEKMESETWLLQNGHYQIEVMANLDKVPPKGALIVVTWPKVKDGLGFPARAFAILP